MRGSRTLGRHATERPYAAEALQTDFTPSVSFRPFREISTGDAAARRPVHRAEGGVADEQRINSELCSIEDRF